jgi:hypothetical protein
MEQCRTPSIIFEKNLESNYIIKKYILLVINILDYIN